MSEMADLADGLIAQWRTELDFPKVPEQEMEMG